MVQYFLKKDDEASTDEWYVSELILSDVPGEPWGIVHDVPAMAANDWIGLSSWLWILETDEPKDLEQVLDMYHQENIKVTFRD